MQRLRDPDHLVARVELQIRQRQFTAQIQVAVLKVAEIDGQRHDLIFQAGEFFNERGLHMHRHKAAHIATETGDFPSQSANSKMYRCPWAS